MKNGIFKLRKEHANFKKLLSLFDKQLDLLHKGKLPDYKLMTDILYYMTQYTDLVHHPIEEVIFKLLAIRDPSIVENITELTKQHQTIGDSGELLYKKLKNIINDGSDIKKYQEIEILGRLYCSTLRVHMDKEEQSPFILAEQLLNNDDWKKIRSDTETKPDPIFGEAIETRFHLVCDQLAQLANDK